MATEFGDGGMVFPGDANQSGKRLFSRVEFAAFERDLYLRRKQCDRFGYVKLFRVK